MNSGLFGSRETLGFGIYDLGFPVRVVSGCLTCPNYRPAGMIVLNGR